MYENCIKLLDPKEGELLLVCVYNEMEGLYELGERIHARFEEAYMNGYNWDALIRYYVATLDPELMEEIETDPEAGSFAAYMPYSHSNIEKMKRFESHIRSMVSDELALMKFIEQNIDAIEWD